jgi:hypothetical protein
MHDVFNTFTSWEELTKARKAKGLHKWDSLQGVAHRLEGKGKQHITFTCSHPSHPGETHVLGSVAGSLHFLLGYGNPGFYLAQYHWQVMDPSVSDEEAAEMYKTRGHPARPELWKQSGLPETAEGDLDAGVPHPSAVEAREQAKREATGIRVQSGVGTYLGVPSEGLLYGEHNDHVYPWAIARGSFMAATNPELTARMDAEASEVDAIKSVQNRNPLVSVSDDVKHRAGTDYSYDVNVYPFVKALFPVPGTILPLVADHSVLGVVTSGSIELVDFYGRPVGVDVYSNVVKSLDLTVDGNTLPSVLLNFAKAFLPIDPSLYCEFAHAVREIQTAPTVVFGDPSPGFDTVVPTAEAAMDLTKSVVIEGNTFRLSIANGS